MQTYRIEVGDPTYEVIKFPAGETHVRLSHSDMEQLGRCDEVIVTSRIDSSDSLIETIMLCDALKQESNRKITLILPYLPYGRADRRFTDGDCFGVSTFARLIDSCKVRVVTLDAHSSSGLAHFENILNLSAEHFIQLAIDKFSNGDPDNITLLFPDKGARERYASAGTRYKNVLHCSKQRDIVTGKLKGFDVPSKSEFPTEKVLLVDDICDGGGTFNGIADGLKDHQLHAGLYVTHGIFSKGLDKLSAHFQMILTTDSYVPKHKFSTDGNNVVFETASFFAEQLAPAAMDAV